MYDALYDALYARQSIEKRDSISVESQLDYCRYETHGKALTNGVHMPTWAASEWKAFYTEHLGAQVFENQSDPEAWKGIFKVKDEDIWNMRMALKNKFINFVRREFKARWLANQGYVRRDHLRQGVATALCDALEAAVDAPRFVTHASITARPFFAHRGYRLLREQQVQRRGVTLTNFVMEKRRQSGKSN